MPEPNSLILLLMLVTSTLHRRLFSLFSSNRLFVNCVTMQRSESQHDLKMIDFLFFSIFFSLFSLSCTEKEQSLILKHENLVPDLQVGTPPMPDPQTQEPCSRSTSGNPTNARSSNTRALLQIYKWEPHQCPILKQENLAPDLQQVETPPKTCTHTDTHTRAHDPQMMWGLMSSDVGLTYYQGQAIPS